LFDFLSVAGEIVFCVARYLFGRSRLVLSPSLAREFYRAPVPVRISLPHSDSSLLGFSPSQFFGLRAQLSCEIIHFSSSEQERTGQEFFFRSANFLLLLFCFLPRFLGVWIWRLPALVRPWFVGLASGLPL
jgi:hypothetical protein